MPFISSLLVAASVIVLLASAQARAFGRACFRHNEPFAKQLRHARYAEALPFHKKDAPLQGRAPQERDNSAEVICAEPTYVNFQLSVARAVKDAKPEIPSRIGKPSTRSGWLRTSTPWSPPPPARRA